MTKQNRKPTSRELDAMFQKSLRVSDLSNDVDDARDVLDDASFKISEQLAKLDLPMSVRRAVNKAIDRASAALSEASDLLTDHSEMLDERYAKAERAAEGEPEPVRKAGSRMSRMGKVGGRRIGSRHKAGR